MKLLKEFTEINESEASVAYKSLKIADIIATNSMRMEKMLIIRIKGLNKNISKGSKLEKFDKKELKQLESALKITKDLIKNYNSIRAIL